MGKSGAQQAEIQAFIETGADRWLLHLRVAHIGRTQLNACKIVKFRQVFTRHQLKLRHFFESSRIK